MTIESEPPFADGAGGRGACAGCRVASVSTPVQPRPNETAQASWTVPPPDEQALLPADTAFGFRPNPAVGRPGASGVGQRVLLHRRDFVRTFALFSAASWASGWGPRSWFVATVTAQSTTQIGIFSMSLDNPAFAALQQDFGSVRLSVTGMPASFHPIIVTRVPGNQFDAVTSLCTHQGGTVNPYSTTLQALRCPNHGSQFAPDGHVLLGPAAQALKRYDATFDGNKTIAVEIPGLGYSATIAAPAAPGTGPSRLRLEFPTVIGLKYEVRFRASVSGGAWVQVPFATTPDGAVTQTVITGTNSKATVYVEGSQQYGFFAVVRY